MLIHPILGLVAFAATSAAEIVHVDVQGYDKLSIDIKVDDEASNDRQLHSNPIKSPRNPTQSRVPFQPSGRLLADYQVELWEGIQQGILSEDGNYVRFKNIPYAEPPIGELRWGPPQYMFEQKTDVNNGSRNAICPQLNPGWYVPAGQFAKDMLSLTPALPTKWRDNVITPDQYESFKPKPELDAAASEDCLLLDITVPKRIWDNKGRSLFGARVVIFIHGGGFVGGYKDQSGSPESLLDTLSNEDVGVIHVAINYRLGAFGFLGGDKFMDDGGYPNAGLMDQRHAIEWVANNIHRFGGSSKGITVMGQSAGASSILHHITAGGGRNYKPAFQSAIISSPAFFPQPNATKDDNTYSKFLALTGAKDLEALFNVSTEILMEANANLTYLSEYGLFEFGPTVDGFFVPNLPAKLLDSGDFHRGIHTLVGHQKFDGLLFTPPWIRTNDLLRDHIRQLYPKVNETVLDYINEKYPIKSFAWGKEKLLAVSDFLDDLAVQCNSHRLTEATLKYPSNSFQALNRFAFNVVPAIHGHDLSYTYFPNFPATPAENPALAKTWQAALMNFTMYYDPNDVHGDGEPKSPVPYWPYYTKDDRKVMNIGRPGQIYFPADNTYSEGDDVLDRERCDFWIDAPYYPAEGKKDVAFVDQSKPKEGL